MLSEIKCCIFNGVLGDVIDEYIKSNQALRYKNYDEKKEEILEYLNSANILKTTYVPVVNLFAMEGLLRSQTRAHTFGISHVPTMIYCAYLRWLYVQGFKKREGLHYIYDGYLLLKNKELFKKDYDQKFLRSLLSGEMGSIREKTNNYGDNGCLGRIVPIGLFCETKTAFKTGQECSLITHGDELTSVACGAYSFILSLAKQSFSFRSTIVEALGYLACEKWSNECTFLIKKAILFFESKKTASEFMKAIKGNTPASVGLALAIFCVLKSEESQLNVEELFLTHLLETTCEPNALDHIYFITGSLFGAYHGNDTIPMQLFTRIENSMLIDELTNDLIIGYVNSKEWQTKYPGH